MVSTQLLVANSDNPDRVGAGTTLTYTLAITNAGPSATSVVTVTDELPAGVTYGDASGDSWSCNHAGGNVTCTLPSLGLEVAPSIAITVTASEDGGWITNTATIAGYEVDLDPRDNAASAETLVKSVTYIYLPMFLR